MTRRLFVCHATADIEATSELVDALENALNFGVGSLWTSGLPGYSAEPNDMPALGAALAGSDVVLALVTQNSVRDAQFHFQLGAGWALGAHTVLFLLDAAAQAQLPNMLNHATSMRGHEPTQWSELVGDLSVRLGLVPRPRASYPPGSLPAYKSAPPPPAAAVGAPSAAPVEREPATVPKMPFIRPSTPLSAAVAATPVQPKPAPAEPKLAPEPTPELAPTQTPQTMIEPETSPRLAVLSEPDTTPEPVPPLPATLVSPVPTLPELKRASSLPPLPAAIPTLSSSATIPHSYLDELRAINEKKAHPAERTPARYSYIDELRELDPNDPLAAGHEAELAPDNQEDEEPETGEQVRVAARTAGSADAGQGQPPVAEMVPSAPDQGNDSDVFARLPTCEMALEAGRAVSDCLFNRDEIDNFGAELDAPLGRLIECLGASWNELRGEQDLDTWLAVTDHLLQTLPDEVRKVEEWYRVGFELATLHNLAGQLVLDGTDAAAEQHWRGALERFLMRAERAEIGYENLGRVLGLLENLAGPSHERDLSNIPRSLAELRRYAAGADIHTAA